MGFVYRHGGVVTEVLQRGASRLPHELTSFVGRRQATADVKGALSESRLVTLTGPGGVGKSRLALRVAHEVRRVFPDGVVLVELAAVQDASLVAESIVTALGLHDQSTRDPEAVLRDYLASRRLLLLLDNCEHLLSVCGVLATTLLSAAVGLRVLATSREPLGIGGERVWPVPPLSLPPSEGALRNGSGRQYEAVALFEDRARAVLPHFAVDHGNVAVVTRLCQRLDGVPLAIELAAVRVRALTVEQILARLEDRFRLLTTANRTALPRHRTLGAAVEWSFDLCSELERGLWARLSVFMGDFDIDAAEQVCSGDGLAAEDVFAGVTGLVDKSVLVREEHRGRARYRMLETIRQYGRERLGDVDALAVGRRHRDHYLWLSERGEAAWFGPDQVEWLDRVRAEQPNVWAALDFCLAKPGEARSALRMFGALWWYWFGPALRDGRYWGDRVLAAEVGASRERAKALWVDGWIAAAQGDFTHALPMLQECRELAGGLGEQVTQGHALHSIAVAQWFRGRLPEAAEALEQAVVHYRAAGEFSSLTALADCDRAMTAGMLGDPDRAVGLCEGAIAACRARGERWACSWGLWHLAFARWLQGDLSAVVEHARESLRFKHELDQVGAAWCVELLAWAAAASGRAHRAAVLFGMAERRWDQIGGGRLSGWQTLCDWSHQHQAQARAALGEQAFDSAYRRGTQLTMDEGLAYALGEGAPVQDAAPSPAGFGAAVPQQLTRREHQVAMLVGAGKSNREIAAELVISQRTAESHVEHILTKLGFTSRAQIAHWIVEQ